MIRISTAALALLLLATVSWAEEPDSCSETSTTSAVHFSLSVKDGRAAFKDGETIPLAMALSSTAKHRYWVTENIGKIFCVEPEAPDPMEVHDAHITIWDRDGLFSENELSKKPEVEDSDLNASRRLRPGHYRVYSVTWSVWHPAGPREKAENDGHISETIRSNTIEFDVQPATSEWRSQQIAAALALAASPKQDDLTRAANMLRYLDTKESARQLAHLFGRPGLDMWVTNDFANGLYASSYHHVAVDAMHKELAAPDEAASQWFLNALVELELDGEPVPSRSAEWVSDPYRKRREELEHEAIDEVVAALPRKTGAARAITLHGLLMEAGQDAALAQSVRPALIGSWKDLPRETQMDLIERNWASIAGAEMLPVLLDILKEQPSPYRTEPGMMRDAALKHIYEMDPAAGLEAIERDLNNPQASPDIALIRLLAPDAISAAIPAVVERIGSGNPRGVDFDLLDRYAGEDALGAVQTVFEDRLGKEDCDPQTHMLQYFLRVAPGYGAEQVKAALGARGTSWWCYKELLTGLEDQLPQAQQVAIDALDDTDDEVAKSAVTALGRWGTAEAEDALWARMERFHQQWKGHESEVRRSPGMSWDTPGARGVELEGRLTSAICSAAGWVCPAEKLARLDKLVITGEEHKEVKDWAAQWIESKLGPVLIDPQWISEDAPTFTVLQYAGLTEDQLIQKLGQFPHGTEFAWQMWLAGQIAPPVSMEKQRAAYERVKTAAEQDGAVVKIWDPSAQKPGVAPTDKDD